MPQPSAAASAKNKGAGRKRTSPSPTSIAIENQPNVEVLEDAREGRVRVVIESVVPEVEAGVFPIKRIAGESVSVEADIFADGHDALQCRLLYRRKESTEWQEVPMVFLNNDRWRASFQVEEVGVYLYTIQTWVDRFVTWRRDMRKRLDAAQSDEVDLMIGAQLVAEAAERATATDAAHLLGWAERLRQAAGDQSQHEIALDESLEALMGLHSDRSFSLRYPKELQVLTERQRARYSTWYEVFPRSCAAQPGKHGTFKDVEAWLPYIAGMGFDVLYLPPVHPIGITNRKGKNNSTVAAPEDHGSPWAIGAEAGGHTAINPDLGTMDDFLHLTHATRQRGMELAMDLAFQCTPDHPWVKHHPNWFRQRPDGTIQYAENPPKKYQDIYPIDFESSDWQALWQELRAVVLFWLEKGIRIFRVDNPHTKAFGFWQWMIADVRERYPDAIFLSEAFTRPKVMYRLAKVGFSQSYTYFTWRNTKDELTEYFTGMAASGVGEYFRPNLWPNTPDILPEYLQTSGRPGFMIRLALAATLGASYGIYGPAFELCESAPRSAGSEEYLDSEKYQLRHRDLQSSWSLAPYIARVNQIRRDNVALQETWNFTFHDIDNPMLLCYSKTSSDNENVLLMVVNLDPQYTQSGWTNLNLAALGLEDSPNFQVHDLVSGARYLWHGPHNYVELNPHEQPAHILRIRHKTRTERDFDYYL